MLKLLDWWHNEASPTLPGFVALFLLVLASSRRVPALRPVVACFAAWSLLDAVTGPLWLRAGVCVAWPGVALVAGTWGLKDEGPGSEPPSPSPASLLPEIDASAGEHRRTLRSGTLLLAIASVYLLAGCVAALTYRSHLPATYHALLPASRALAVLLVTLAAVLRPRPRTWAARACVAPALGLACGVVAGVWTVLPAGLGAVRDAWARLAGAETLVTMGVTAGCVVAAWWEARRASR